jgi:hypothetical protein
MTRMKRLLAGTVALLAMTGAFLATSSSSGAVALDKVDIRVELDLPYCCPDSGPAIFVANGVTPGAGVELDGSNLVANPSDWCGSLQVDIDPDAQTITISPDEGCDFETAVVTISTSEIATITNTSDNLWETPDPPAPPMVRTEAASPTGVTIRWDTGDAGDDSASVFMTDGGSAVFAFTTAKPALTAVPTAVVRGDNITVSGDRCTGPTATPSITDGTTTNGGTAVTVNADGTWSTTLPTTGLTGATATVNANCDPAPVESFPPLTDAPSPEAASVGFAYDPVTITFIEPTTTTVAEEEPTAAEAVVATPTFTG